MNTAIKKWCLFLFFFGVGICQSHALGIVTFGPKETRIEGSIPYTVVGHYRAQFRAFKGRITLDEGSEQIRSVYLKIEVKSIVSNCSWCDKIARSRRLLNPTRYPYIIFKSDQIIHDEKGYRVKGVLEMHGIKRVMTFPFDVQIKKQLLVIHGNWVVNRKDFNIVWSRYLDRGGVVVGDYFTVDWGIKAYL